MDDSHIIALFWHRDEQAIRETQQKYGAYCTTIANNVLCSPEDSQECVQDALLRLWDTIPPQRPRCLQAYLGRITRNLAVNRLRSICAQRRGGGLQQLPLEELRDLASGQGDPPTELEKRRLADSISVFLRTLPPEKRRISVLRYWYAEPLSQVAAETDHTEDQVRNMLFRLRKKLKKHLEKEGFTL